MMCGLGAHQGLEPDKTWYLNGEGWNHYPFRSKLCVTSTRDFLSLKEFIIGFSLLSASVFKGNFHTVF